MTRPAGHCAEDRGERRRLKCRGLALAVLATVACMALRALGLGAGAAGRAGAEASRVVDGDFRAAVGRVDQAFAEGWRASGLDPTDRASDLTLARRGALALMGTVPSLEEIRRFEQGGGDRWAHRAIEAWLEDRRCSEYLAERLARALVGVEDGPFIIFRRHRLVQWLADQLERNRPYDAIVRQLIAAEGIWTTQPEVNFLTATVDQNVKDQGPDEQKLAARVARTFLGVRLDCVQCHDDKLGGSWKQRDFHQLAAFFGGAEMSLTGVRDDPAHAYAVRLAGRTEKEPVPPRVPFQERLARGDGPLRVRLGAWVTHPENRPFARALVNRVWALLFGRPIHEPVDDIPLTAPWPPALEALSDDFIAHGFDLRRLIRVITATRVFQLESRSSDPDRPVTVAQQGQWAAFPVTRLRAEQIAGATLQSARLATIDAGAHVLVRLARHFQQRDFVQHYGDAGEDELVERGGTLPQRLVLMNGRLVKERTREDLAMNAATRIGVLAPDDATAVEVAYLAVLTRRPTAAEREHFVARFRAAASAKRAELMEDLCWTLLNSTEFAWNH